MKKSNIDGFLFLPDGKVLVINNDLYEEVLKKGIVIDLKQQESDAAILEEGEESKQDEPVTHSRSGNVAQR